MKIILIMLTLVSQQLFAEEFIVNIQRKQADKYENRWTLSSWFEDKRKMRLQDMWLAGNVREDNYEFFIGASTAKDVKFSSASETLSDSSSYELAAYATIAGLAARSFSEDANNISGWEAEFKLRILGTSLQNTNLVLGYGVRNTKTPSAEYKNNMLKLLMTLYFTKLFGVSTEYTLLSPATSGLSSFEGSEVEAQLFLDFNLLRIYGSAISGFRSTTTGSTVTKTNISGFKTGLKLFF